jgi:two-component system sensor histidine kinase YesM
MKPEGKYSLKDESFKHGFLCLSVFNRNLGYGEIAQSLTSCKKGMVINMGGKSVRKISALLKLLRFENLPLIFKLLIGFGSILLFMVLLSLIMFNFYTSDKENNTLSIISQMNSQAINKIDDYVTDVSSVTKLPLFKDSYGEGYYNDFLARLTEFNSTNSTSIEIKQLVELLAYNIFNYKSSISSVFVFNLNGKSEYKMTNNELYKEYNPKSERWFQKCIDSLGSPVYISTFLLPYISNVRGNNAYVFSVARGIVNIDNARVIGVIMVNTNADYLTNICNKMLFVKGQRILIVDSTGTTVCDTSAHPASKIDKNLWNDVGDLDGATTITIKNRKYLVSCQMSSLPETSWKIVNIIPDSELTKQINQSRNTTIVVTLILILSAISIAFLISRQIVKPLKKLVIVMKIVEKGDFNVQANFSGKDEVGHLAATFNNMVAKIKKLIEEDYLNRIRQKDLELQMLQSQINPHFLYNTLESIHMTAEINKDHEASVMVTTLGKFLRYSIGSSNEISTVRDEINHLEEYTFLQKVRFESMFSIIVNIDEDIYDSKIIKLILQPPVENAIYHGLDNMSSGGKIEVRGRRQEGNIIFEISDNGCGMNPETVEKMNGYINGFNKSFKGIGLKNVNKRIKLHYGEEFGLVIVSSEGMGTTVIITLPYEDL